MSQYLFDVMVHECPALRALSQDSVTIPQQILPPMSVRETLTNMETMPLLAANEEEYKAIVAATKTINTARQRVYNSERTQWFYKAMIQVLPR
jgi:hypothetical protein